MVAAKEHLSNDGLLKVRAIQKTINLNNSVTNKTGDSLIKRKNHRT
jgi:hypothetical protein